MKGINHILFSVLLSLLVIRIINLSLLYLPLLVFLGILPDVDMPGSRIGRLMKPVGWIFKHRGYFHSVWLMFAVFFISYTFSGNIFLSFLLIIPLAGHFLLDSLNPQGIRPFYPLSFRLSGPFKSGALFDKLLQVFWLFCIAFLLIYLIGGYSTLF